MSVLDEIICRSTILIPSGPSHDPNRMHLHILLNDPVFVESPIIYNNIISSPTQLIQMVSISSYNPEQPCDPTCILDPGEHEFVKHKSFVCYAYTRVVAAQAIQLSLDEKTFVLKERVTEDVFARVHAGVGISDDTPIKMSNFWRLYC